MGSSIPDHESPRFLAVNRNKQSVRLDYSRPEGLAVLRDLLSRANVVVLNQIPRAAKKLGIDPDPVREVRPGRNSYAYGRKNDLEDLVREQFERFLSARIDAANETFR
jgi:CoA-transferase family III